MILPKQEIDETVNFQNFRKLFKNKFFSFFEVFWHPIFKQEKRNKVTGHMKHAPMTVTCTLHWGSWCSCKKTVIITMNKMLYFYVIVFRMFTTICFSNDFSNFEGFLMPLIGSTPRAKVYTYLKSDTNSA